ncbi:hypothetical protein U1Q18_033936 [Sarracenia purpurea var. burkii]
MSLTDYIRSGTKLPDPIHENIDSPCRDCCHDWMASAIPVDNVVALTAAAAGIILDDDVPSSSCRWDPLSPEGGSTSEASEMEKDGRKNQHYFDDYASEASENASDGVERMNESWDNGQTPPDGVFVWHRSRTLEHLEGSESLFSPVRSMGSEDEDDDIFLSHEKEVGAEIILEWARENNNDILQIVCGYHAMPLPTRGSEIVFQPLEHLQAIEYRRPSVAAVGLSERYLDQKLEHLSEAAEVYELDTD